MLLLVGAEALIRGASRLALAVGLSPLVIGLTVVAFGTSTPELAITVDAAVRGAPDIALGNVVGSNIANVLLILGLTAMIAPLIVNRQLIRVDVPVMIAVSLGVCAMALDGVIARWEGTLLIACAVVYTVALVRIGRRRTKGAIGGEAPPPPGTWWVNLLFMAAGLALLVLGAQLLVQAAVSIATGLGVGELVIGLTVVAVGTSLPEIATSMLAAIRGEREMAVGNIVGSNIFNLLLVLGISAGVAPDGVPVSDAAIRFDLPVMAAVAFACLPIFFTGHCIARWEGTLFFGFYLAYMAYLLLQAAHHDALPTFSMAMFAFVLPLTFITLAVVTLRAYRLQSRPSFGNDAS
ncbi:cation:H+ antiporter [Chiayiivirga flava]|uniref:Cation:H+ antiporter n=1 Tax=Chiayiivirga flava TaxID=659595 RepID=A0A7W8G0D6_9GAMM|nr:cation:H+ antiporter [Chiayiivirga flava]